MARKNRMTPNRLDQTQSSIRPNIVAKFAIIRPVSPPLFGRRFSTTETAKLKAGKTSSRSMLSSRCVSLIILHPDQKPARLAAFASLFSPRILPELRLAEICAEGIKPRDFEGSAPNQRRLAIIFRLGGVARFRRMPGLTKSYR